MVEISDLPEDMLVKTISFLPTKEAVSTSILSKQWKFLWTLLPKLEFYLRNRPESSAYLRDFIDKKHKARIIESLHLSSDLGSLEPEDLERLVDFAVSRRVRELSICLDNDMKKPALSFGRLYNSYWLVSLKLYSKMVLVEVAPGVCLPSLKTLGLESVTYSNDNSLRILLSCCHVLQELVIHREDYDNLRRVVIDVPSLQRLTLSIAPACTSDGYVIETPSLKYFKVVEFRSESSCFIKPMPELEEASIWVMEDTEKEIEMLLMSVTAVKRLSICIRRNSGCEKVYRDPSIVFKQLESLTLGISSENWSMLLVQLIKDSPYLKIINLLVKDDFAPPNGEYEPAVSWSEGQSFLDSLQSLKFEGYDCQEPEHRDVRRFISKHAPKLESTSLLPP